MYEYSTPMSNKAFNYMIQKVVNKKNKIYNLEGHSLEVLGVLQEIATNEFKDSSSDTMDMNLIRRFYYSYIREKNFLLKTKFNFFKKSTSNIFMTVNQKNIFMDFFQQIQKVYHAFSRLAYIYKFKKAKIQVSSDLFMNPLSSKQKNVFTLYQNNYKYLFTITDLNNIMLASLCNSINFFSFPQPCKNPYNNMYFNKSTLYNIYFFIKFRHHNVPILIQNYFKSYFNLDKFKSNNEALIREHTIKNYVYTTPVNELYEVVLEMFSGYKFHRKSIYVDEDFPKDKLVEIMRPYLHLYYKSKYSLESYQRYDAIDLLHAKMRKFILFNPQFGRKNIKLVQVMFNKKKCIVTFNDSHVNFYKNSEAAFHNFEKSHLLEDEREDQENNPFREPSPEIIEQIIDSVEIEYENPELSEDASLGTYTNYAATFLMNRNNSVFFDASMNLLPSFIPFHIHSANIYPLIQNLEPYQPETQDS